MPRIGLVPQYAVLPAPVAQPRTSMESAVVNPVTIADGKEANVAVVAAFDKVGVAVVVPAEIRVTKGVPA